MKIRQSDNIVSTLLSLFNKHYAGTDKATAFSLVAYHCYVTLCPSVYIITVKQQFVMNKESAPTTSFSKHGLSIVFENMEKNEVKSSTVNQL